MAGQNILDRWQRLKRLSVQRVRHFQYQYNSAATATTQIPQQSSIPAVQVHFDSPDVHLLAAIALYSRPYHLVRFSSGRLPRPAPDFSMRTATAETFQVSASTA
jgi:hypothetical protein